MSGEETDMFCWMSFLSHKAGQAKQSWPHTVTHSIKTWRNLILSFISVQYFSLYFFPWLQLSAASYQIYLKGLFQFWILHSAEIVGYVFQFWELKSKTSAYHRNSITNADSINTEKIRKLSRVLLFFCMKIKECWPFHAFLTSSVRKERIIHKRQFKFYIIQQIKRESETIMFIL